MRNSFIDSASLFDVVTCLARSRPDKCTGTILHNAENATRALTVARNVTLIALPGREGLVVGAYGALRDGLDFLTIGEEENDAVREQAMRECGKWAENKTKDINKLVKSFDVEGTEEQIWFEEGVHYRWPMGGAARLGSLVDSKFIQEISLITGISKNALTDIHERSRDQELVKGDIGARLGKEKFSILKRAYAASILLRGRYYCHLAALRDMHYWPHPVRSSVLDPGRDIGDPDPLHLTNTERILSRIILGLSFVERDHRARVQHWVENIKVIRAGVRSGSMSLHEAPSEDRAFQNVYNFLKGKSLKVKFHSRRFNMMYTILSTMGLAATAYYYFDPFTALMVGPPASIIALESKEPIARITYGSKRRLRDLAEMPPGRITAK